MTFHGSSMVIGPEVVAELAYRLFDAEGELVEEGGREAPLAVLFGFAQLPHDLEQALEGAAVGERRSIELSPERAFGLRDAQAVLQVERSELGPDARVGDELEAEDAAGETVFLRVVELDTEVAVLDANHPLAGQAIRLEVEVLATRIASSAEVDEAESSWKETIVTDQAWVSASRLVRRRASGEDAPPES